MDEYKHDLGSLEVNENDKKANIAELEQILRSNKVKDYLQQFNGRSPGCVLVALLVVRNVNNVKNVTSWRSLFKKLKIRE
jgi:hypothetical protein